jgi:hypothetical protein
MALEGAVVPKQGAPLAQDVLSLTCNCTDSSSGGRDTAADAPVGHTTSKSPGCSLRSVRHDLEASRPPFNSSSLPSSAYRTFTVMPGASVAGIPTNPPSHTQIASDHSVMWGGMEADAVVEPSYTRLMEKEETTRKHSTQHKSPYTACPAAPSCCKPPFRHMFSVLTPSQLESDVKRGHPWLPFFVCR